MRICHLKSRRYRGSKTLNLLLYHLCFTACFGSTIRHTNGIYRVLWMSHMTLYFYVYVWAKPNSPMSSLIFFSRISLFSFTQAWSREVKHCWMQNIILSLLKNKEAPELRFSKCFSTTWLDSLNIVVMLKVKRWIKGDWKKPSYKYQFKPIKTNIFRHSDAFKGNMGYCSYIVSYGCFVSGFQKQCSKG